MSVPLLSLFDLRNGQIILAPQCRHRAIITIGNEHTFGRIVDRDRGNAVLADMEDARLVCLLARLVARGIAIGIFRPPPGNASRIGVRHDVEEHLFGCYALDDEGRGHNPIVAVEYDLCLATATLPRQPEWFAGETVEHAMLQATGAFMTHSLAA